MRCFTYILLLVCSAVFFFGIGFVGRVGGGESILMALGYRAQDNIDEITSVEAKADRDLYAFAKAMNIENLVEVLRQCDSLIMKEHVSAVVAAYYPDYIRSVSWENDDVKFDVNGTSIWYSEGRLLNSSSLTNSQKYRGILYPYSTEPIEEIIDGLPKPMKDFSTHYVRSSDFQYALYGSTAQEISSQIEEYRILKIGVRLHPIAARQAKLASDELLSLAKNDAELNLSIDRLKTMSGFRERKVLNSSNISMHAFGIAFDLIPYSYGRKESYWAWTKVHYPDTWDTMPLDRRWHPHPKVIEVFEKYGFIWGGKWPNYDTIHLEYRPELIWYSKVRKVTNSPLDWGVRNDNGRIEEL